MTSPVSRSLAPYALGRSAVRSGHAEARKAARLLIPKVATAAGPAEALALVQSYGDRYGPELDAVSMLMVVRAREQLQALDSVGALATLQALYRRLL